VVVIPCLLAPFLAGRGLDPVQRSRWFLLAAWAAGCHIGIALPGHWGEYYFELWLPVYALAGGALLASLFSEPLETSRLWRWALPALVFAPLAIRMVHGNEYGSKPWSVYEVGSPEYLFRHEARDAALAINRLLTPGERFYALGTPGQSAPLYLYCRQDPPSGIFYDFPLKPGKPFADELEERIIRDLDRGPPDLIVFHKISNPFVVHPQIGPWGKGLVDWVVPRYSFHEFDALKQYLCFARRGSALEQRVAEGEKQ
jgi:hypothetical protein